MGFMKAGRNMLGMSLTEFTSPAVDGLRLPLNMLGMSVAEFTFQLPMGWLKQQRSTSGPQTLSNVENS